MVEAVAEVVTKATTLDADVTVVVVLAAIIVAVAIKDTEGK